MYIFGRTSGLLSTVAVVAALIGGGANAQSLRNSTGPAETPPASFTSNQYIDSRGCVYVRAGIGGTVNWVPRVSRSREQLCGFQPSGSSSPIVAQAPVEAPSPAPAPVVAAAPEPAPTPAVRAPAPTPVVQPPVIASAPAQRVARPATITPQIGQPATVAPASALPSPRVITAPSTQPRTITRAQACAGLTGVQPNLISQRTGQPIDCGNALAPQIAAAAPRPVPQAPAAGPSRLNRAQACADMNASGRQYISARTGLPIQCGQPAAPTTQSAFGRLQADLALPQRPYSNPLDYAPGSTFDPRPAQITAQLNRAPYSNPLDSAPGSTFTPNANTRFAVGPSGVSTGQDIVSRSRTSISTQGFVGSLLNQDPPPYSNPTNSYALAAPTVPNGFDRVWSDGRLNTQRGIPAGSYTQSPSSNRVQYATAPRAPQAVEQPRVTTRASAPQPQRRELISGHRYVQVGTYETRNQAQSIAQSLRSRGLPMRVGVFNQNGHEMRIVLAGPFGNDSQLQSALGTARGAGYSGAFTRR